MTLVPSPPQQVTPFCRGPSRRVPWFESAQALLEERDGSALEREAGDCPSQSLTVEFERSRRVAFARPHDEPTEFRTQRWLECRGAGVRF